MCDVYIKGVCGVLMEKFRLEIFEKLVYEEFVVVVKIFGCQFESWKESLKDFKGEYNVLGFFQKGFFDIIVDCWKCLRRGCSDENVYEIDIEVKGVRRYREEGKNRRFIGNIYSQIC